MTKGDTIFISIGKNEPIKFQISYVSGELLDVWNEEFSYKGIYNMNKKILTVNNFVFGESEIVNES